MHDLYHHLTLYFRELEKAGEKPLLVVLGPTASGKTSLSLKLAEDFDGEIISADSAQVYRKMDIGTAKVTVTERARVPHHLIDIRNPNQSFTMADFKAEATRAIKAIHQKGKVPIICGGTGLYISALVDNYELPKAPPNPDIREELQKEYEEKGKDHLYQMLLELDPKTASKIHPNNVRYVARALEIVLQTQKPIERRKGDPAYNVFKMAVQWDRELLYERINQRVLDMVEEGLINEIKTLLAEGYTPEMQALSAIGYKELIPYIQGEAELEECIETLQKNSRNFAKRQLTWFRKEEDLYWVQPEEFFAITKHAS